MNSIVVKDLRHSYNGTVAVDGISFNVAQGEIFGLLAPNRAVKTTTTEILFGLKKRKAGLVEVLGFDPSDQDEELKSRIGVQLQIPSLFQRLTVKELLNLFATFYPDPLNIEEVIEKVGLQDKTKTISMKLSGGKLQRLSVALALVSNGDLIFLDEPTTGLDPQARRGLWDVIENLKKEGKTVFLTTHYMDEAEKLCDRVAIIDYGKVIALSSPNDLIKSNFTEQALEFDVEADQKAFLHEKLPSVSKIEFNEDKATVYTQDVTKTVAELLAITDNGFRLKSFTVRSASLEDVFLKLTGRRIR